MKGRKMENEKPAAKRQKQEHCSSALPPHRYILAPMVGGSELAFRLLCRRYATPNLLCYTPMMNSARFATEPAYRAEAFATTPEDRPLVAHFSGNDPQEMLAAARHVEKKVDAIDLNLGCPQRIAHSGHFGSFLLDDVDRPLVLSIVRTLASGLSIPVFCKIRLLQTTKQTIELCTSLRDAGAALIAIHARHRVSLVGRSGPTARDGPALLEEVAKIVRAVGGVRIIANGNVKTWDDVRANLALTGAHGVMSAEGILDNPAIFLPSLDDDASASQAHSGGGGSGGLAAAADGAAEEAAREARKLRKKIREVERLEARKALLTAEERAKLAKKAALLKALRLHEKVIAKAEARAAKRAAKMAAKAGAATNRGDDGAPPTACGTSGLPTDDARASLAEPVRASPRDPPTPLGLAQEYLALAETHSVPLRTVVFHTRRMAKQALTEYQMMGEMLAATDLPGVRQIIERCVHYAAHGYTPDPEKAKREGEALELKKWREATRKRYEERMVRKAVRAGLSHDHYLEQGAEAPSAEVLGELRAMPPADAFARWKKCHGQHCWAWHMDAAKCSRERTCAFIHVDVAEAEPGWHG